MRILGISAFYHDSAAALIEDGRIVAAAQEERFTRKKHDPSFPHNAITYCLAEGGVAGADLLAQRFAIERPAGLEECGEDALIECECPATPSFAQ